MRPRPARFLFLLVPGLGLIGTASARDLTRYAVVLSGPAAISRADRSDGARFAAARANVRAAHDAVKTRLRSLGARVTGETDTLLNAVFVQADAPEVAAMQALPGVRYVARLPVFHRSLDAAVKLISAPAAWTLLGGTGNAGAGVKIAIIDTGIDANHPAFRDAGLAAPAGFPICGTPSDCAFTNNKIIVARSYVAMVAAGSGANPAADSRPDDYSARDRVGHGTAVAMAAAGVTNTGPSDTIAGVAPGAFLGNYKVFGSPDVSDGASGDAILSAIEDAYKDGMDIAGISLGAPAFYGPTDTGVACGAPRGQPCDLIAAMVQSAAAGSPGMVVVVAAGNGGSSGSATPSLGTVTSPGDAPAAISVAATTNSHQWSNALTVGDATFRSALGNGPAPQRALTAPLSDVASVGDSQACSAPPPNSLAGTFALVARGACTFVVKVQNLQTAGAVGAIITNNPGDDTLVIAGGLSGTTIPATSVGYEDGQAIRGYLANHEGATASLNPDVSAVSPSAYNQVAPFSSRGPVLGSAAVKPDVAAAGTDLYLAAQSYDPNGDLYSANGYVVSQGTSFSTPQISGLAALVKQAHAGFSVAQVKSAIVNTAAQSATDGGSAASVLAVGGGIANAAAAVGTNLTASPASISFGIVKALPLSQQIQLTNAGTTPLNLQISLNRRTPDNNASASIDLPGLSVAPGATGTFHLLLSGDVPSPGIYEGLVMVQGAASTLAIPYAYVVGSGAPADLVSILGDGDTGIAGQSGSEGALLLQVLDQYGVPVPGAPVSFSAIAGGGSVSGSDAQTDGYGFAGSMDKLGVTPGTNVFAATAGPLSTTFTITSVYQPAIAANGAVNAADFTQLSGAAPGSLISLFGSNLAPASAAFFTPYFPLSLEGASVSFDTTTVSAPGYLLYVSPGQVNVQVPWELQSAIDAGEKTAQIKVSIGGVSGALYTLPLAGYAPGIFQSPGNQAAALDESNRPVSTSNPAAAGSVVQLFVNGLGPVMTAQQSGAPVSAAARILTTTPATVKIGGLDAVVEYSGLAPGYAGLYQVNAVVPATGPGLQPITVSIGGVTGAAAMIAVR